MVAEARKQRARSTRGASRSETGRRATTTRTATRRRRGRSTRALDCGAGMGGKESSGTQGDVTAVTGARERRAQPARGTSRRRARNKASSVDVPRRRGRQRRRRR